MLINDCFPTILRVCPISPIIFSSDLNDFALKKFSNKEIHKVIQLLGPSFIP